MAQILIVEDEKPINELLRRNLTLVGHSCFQAFCGEEALRLAEEKSIDLVILDIMLPKMSGLDVLKQLSLPAIILTARGSLNDRVAGLDLGADDYIVKPFETLELLARVNAVLRRTRKSEKSFTLGGFTADFLAQGREIDNIEIDGIGFEWDDENGGFDPDETWTIQVDCRVYMETGMCYNFSFWGTDELILKNFSSHPTKQACQAGFYFEEYADDYPPYIR